MMPTVANDQRKAMPPICEMNWPPSHVDLPYTHGWRSCCCVVIVEERDAIAGKVAMGVMGG